MGCIHSPAPNTDLVLLSDQEVPNIENPSQPTEPPGRSSIVIKRKQFICARAGHISDYYTIKEVLGTGSFSTVNRAIHNETGQERAIKIINKLGIAENSTQQVSEEVEILSELDHPNIIKIFEVFEDETTLNIVTELCTGKELFNKIVDCKPFSENQAAVIMYQILSGLITTHEAGIIHRDLKPENLLFLRDSDDSPLKIIDFGISQRIKANTKLVNFVGSAYYIAPEVIEGSYDMKCDIWSCGVILYLMLCGNPPFNGKDESAIFSKISRGVFGFSGQEWACISREAKSLIKKMLTKNVDQRITAQDAFSDPWIQSRAHGLVEDRLIDEGSLNMLVQFRTRSKLQQATMAFIANHLVSNQEIEGLRKMFVSLDINGDGKLNLEELRRGFVKFPNLSGMNIEEILKHCDSDMNGLIDYNEFLTATLNWQKTLSHDRLESAFRAYDKDQSGTITAKEIKAFISDGSQVEEDVWEEILREADTNGDGVLDLEEFKSVMLKKID